MRDNAGMLDADILDSPEAGRAVVRGGAMRGAGFVVGLLAALAAAVVLTRQLGAERYGQYQTVVALVMILQTALDLGMSMLAMREWSQRPEADRQRFLRQIIGLRIVLGLGILTTATVIALALGYPQQMVEATFVLGVGTVFALVGTTVIVPLQAELRNGAVTSIDLSRQLIAAGTVIVLVLLGVESIVPFAAVAIVANVAFLVAGIWFVRNGHALRPLFHPRAWLAVIRTSVSFSFATAAGSLYAYAAVVITQQVATAYQTGIFSISFRVWTIAATVPAVLVTTVFPLFSRAARDDRERLAGASQRVFEAMSFAGGAVLIACVVGAPFIIRVLGGPQFQPAEHVLPIHGLALGMTFILVGWGFVLIALHEHRAMIVINLIGLLVVAVAVITLAGRYGAKGAAWGTVFGEMTLFVGYGLALTRADRILRPRFLPVLRLLPGAGVGLVVAFTLPITSVSATALALLLYGAGAVWLRAIPEDLLVHLPGLSRFARS